MLILICLYIIIYYVIKFIYLLMFSRLSLLFPFTITRELGIRIRFTAGNVSARTDVILGSLDIDLLDILQFAA